MCTNYMMDVGWLAVACCVKHLNNHITNTTYYLICWSTMNYDIFKMLMAISISSTARIGSVKSQFGPILISTLLEDLRIAKHYVRFNEPDLTKLFSSAYTSPGHTMQNMPMGYHKASTNALERAKNNTRLCRSKMKHKNGCNTKLNLSKTLILYGNMNGLIISSGGDHVMRGVPDCEGRWLCKLQRSFSPNFCFFLHYHLFKSHQGNSSHSKRTDPFFVFPLMAQNRERSDARWNGRR